MCLPLKPLLVYSKSRKVDHAWVAYSKGGWIIICAYLMIGKGQIAQKTILVRKLQLPQPPVFKKFACATGELICIVFAVSVGRGGGGVVTLAPLSLMGLSVAWLSVKSLTYLKNWIVLIIEPSVCRLRSQ